MRRRKRKKKKKRKILMMIKIQRCYRLVWRMYTSQYLFII